MATPLSNSSYVIVKDLQTISKMIEKNMTIPPGYIKAQEDFTTTKYIREMEEEQRIRRWEKLKGYSDVWDPDIYSEKKTGPNPIAPVIPYKYIPPRERFYRIKLDAIVVIVNKDLNNSSTHKWNAKRNRVIFWESELTWFPSPSDLVRINADPRSLSGVLEHLEIWLKKDDLISTSETDSGI